MPAVIQACTLKRSQRQEMDRRTATRAWLCGMIARASLRVDRAILSFLGVRRVLTSEPHSSDGC